VVYESAIGKADIRCTSLEVQDLRSWMSGARTAR
jgi:hypothetical protein